ncbi:hypothetical protein LTS09_008497 [Friedmanniomyces endolithicus]|nr:hypothetical protein LTS09_008497 [Friedmanniomyces endolithicus]
MKLTTTLTALFATTTLAMTDLEMCQKKNPHAVQAIQQFCAKTDIVAPSSYATAGAHVGTGGAHDTRLSIEAYYNMCATGDDVGDANDRFYGAGNYHCQTWHFSVGGPYGGL